MMRLWFLFGHCTPFVQLRNLGVTSTFAEEALRNFGQRLLAPGWHAMTERLILIVTMLVALTVGVEVQSNPLLGVWELNLPKSKYQHDATPLGETRSYKECDGSGVGTYVETTYVNWRVAVTTFCTHLDGKEYPYMSRIADSIRSTGAHWGEFDATISENGKVVRTTRTVVSQDGKTLTRTTTYAAERETDLQVYDKQPDR